MTSGYVIVSIKLRPKVENDKYIFLSKFGDRSMNDLEAIEGSLWSHPGSQEAKKARSE